MVKPAACDSETNAFYECLQCSSIFSRLFGKCEDERKMMEGCYKKQIYKKIASNRDRAKQSNKKWKELNEELGV